MITPQTEPWTPDPSEALLRDVRRMLLDRINNRLTVLLALIHESRMSGEAVDDSAGELARSISETVQDLSYERLVAWRSRYGEAPLA